MQTLSLIPECKIMISTKAEKSVTSYEELSALPLKNSQSQTLYMPNHAHGTSLWVISKENQEQIESTADIVLTREKTAILVHQFADCVPFLIVDRKQKALGFTHAGWKGLSMGAVSISVLAMQAYFDSQIDDLWIWIGPCIQKASYLFADEPIQTKLPRWNGFILPTEAGWSVDLPGFALSECVAIGMDPTHIISDGRDTFSESETFFSHQRCIRTSLPEEKGTFVIAVTLSQA